MSLPASLQMREVTGRFDYTAVQQQCTELLTEYYEHEYMYDHSDLAVLYVMLLERVKARPSALAIVYDYCCAHETADDDSIVWLAKDYARKSNDIAVAEICEEITEHSLMPKKYIYTKRDKTQNYEDKQLEDAVKAVEDGSLSIRKASATFGVPRSTIGDRISGKHEMHVQRGRPTHIPRDIENKIVDAVKMAARRGIGLTRKQVLSKTSILSKRTKIGSGYDTFKAGKDWWEGVKRRHPDVAIRKPERLTSTRARMMNREVISRYFHDLETIVEGLNIATKPHLIWNCDEMGKNFEHEPVRVVAEKGENCLSRTSSKSTNITIMACVSASGKRMPPMFVVKGKTSRSLHGFNTSMAPTGSRWAFQKSGWMDDSLGEKWFNDVFLKHCGNERPQLLILDGHSSHETLGILMRAMEENVHILALPPHTTHYLQPLDRAVFGPLNRAYNKECSEYLQENPLHQINKWSFPELFRKSWNNAVTSTNVLSGFKACGIFPLNKACIPDKAFGPSEPSDKPIEQALSIETPLNPHAVSTPYHETSNTSCVATLIDGFESPQLTTSFDPMLTETCPPTQNNSYEMTFNEINSAEIQSDVGLQAVSDVLDLSDPQELFQLMSEGTCSIHTLTDQNGEQVIVPATPATPCLSYETIDHSIESLFIPPKTAGQTKKKQIKKNITTHRLLTSEEIIGEKVAMENIKQEKMKRKSERESKVKKLGGKKKIVKKEPIDNM